MAVFVDPNSWKHKRAIAAIPIEYFSVSIDFILFLFVVIGMNAIKQPLKNSHARENGK